MFNKVRKLIFNQTAKVMAVFGLLFSGNVLAGLPTPVAPTTAPAAGDYLGHMTGWFNDAGDQGALIMAILAFIVVGGAILYKFNAVRQGKAEWGDFTGIAIGGGIVLVIIMFFLGQATGII